MTASSFPWPSSFPRCSSHRLTVDGDAVDLLHSSVGPFVILEGTGPITLAIEVVQAAPVTRAVLRPLRHAIEPSIEDRTIRFALPGPMDVALDLPGIGDVFVFYAAPDAEVPDRDDPQVRWFEAGQSHEVGELDIGPGETLYIEGGAVLRGALRLAKADGAQVLGRGIVDNSAIPRGGTLGTRNAWLAEHCSGIELRGPTFVESQTWTVKTAACRDVRIAEVRILCGLNAADGIDITGTEGALVEGCFVRSGDDCYAIKSVEYGRPGPRRDYCVDVRDVTVRNCVAYSYGGGSAMELGHEFRCAHVQDITFEDIDVLAVHQYGAALSISHCDDALIERVRFERIRVEHHYHELIGFKIVRSEYKPSRERGNVRDVLIRDLLVDVQPCNHGYSCSHIGGWDDEHRFDGIRIERMRYGDVVVAHLDDFDCYTKYARNIDIIPGEPVLDRGHAAVH